MSSGTDGAGAGRRPYRLGVRAEAQAETRRRIAAATAALHREVGPARTTIAEIARRAGVRRPTVYNNFPGERALLAACQEQVLAERPPPDFAGALARQQPRARLEEALRRLYGWYRETEDMTGNVQRDRALVPELDALLRETSDAALEGLADALGGGDRRRRAFVRLTLDFATWRRLTAEGLSDEEAAALMADAVAA